MKKPKTPFSIFTWLLIILFAYHTTTSSHWSNRPIYFVVESNVKCYVSNTKAHLTCVTDDSKVKTTLKDNNKLYFQGQTCVKKAPGKKLEIGFEEDCVAFKVTNGFLKTEDDDYVCPQSRKLKTSSVECNYEFVVETGEESSTGVSQVINPSLTYGESTQIVETPVFAVMTTTLHSYTISIQAATATYWMNYPIYFMINNVKNYVYIFKTLYNAYLVCSATGEKTLTTLKKDDGKLYFGNVCIGVEIPMLRNLGIRNFPDCNKFEIVVSKLKTGGAFVCPNPYTKELYIQDEECEFSFHVETGEESPTGVTQVINPSLTYGESTQIVETPVFAVMTTTLLSSTISIQAATATYWMNYPIYFMINNVKYYVYILKTLYDTYVMCSATGEKPLTTLKKDDGKLFFGNVCIGLKIAATPIFGIKNFPDCNKFEIVASKLKTGGAFVCPNPSTKELYIQEEVCEFNFHVELEQQATSTSSIVEMETTVVQTFDIETATTAVETMDMKTTLVQTVDMETTATEIFPTSTILTTHSMITSATKSLSSLDALPTQSTPTTMLQLFSSRVISPSPVKTQTTIVVTSSIVSQQQGSYYGIFTSWVENKCPVKCKLSYTSRQRKCKNFRWRASNNHIMINSSSTSKRCTYDEMEDIQCLDLTNCNGTRYYLAQQGWSCQKFCQEKGLKCNPFIETGNSADIFKDVILNYTPDLSYTKWTSGYSPYCRPTGECAEYLHLPESVECDAVPPSSYRRLCLCEEKDDVGFGSWSPWASCSKTCNGTRIRSRECFDYCYGDSIETEKCGAPECPVHGGLSQWTSWSSCTKPCYVGTRVKSRSCDQPQPSNNGKPCVGVIEITEECNVQYCPVDAKWSEWTSWSACRKPCNNGTYMRQRFCSQALYGGNVTCDGESMQTMPCNEQPCPKTSVSMRIPLDQTFSADYLNKSSIAFKRLEQTLLSQFNETFSNEETGFSIIGVTLNFARKGSVIVNITVQFSSFDSYQFVSVQDSIEVDESIGKLSIATNGTVLFNIDNRVPSMPPENISISSTSTIFNISWIPVHGIITGYVAFYREKIMISSPYSIMSSVNTNLEIAGLHPGTTYVMRLLAHTQDGNGVSSNLLDYTTKETYPSMAPSSLQTSSYGAFSLYIEWDGISRRAMNGLPLGYNIYIYFNNSLINITQTLYGQQNTIVTGLRPSTLYVFQVCAYNRIGNGPCERTTGKTLPSRPTSEPLNISVDETKTHNQLTIFWERPEKETIHGDLIGYQIVKTSQDGSHANLTVHPAFTSYILENLMANTKYMIKVFAVNEHGIGPPAVVEAETCKCPEVVTTSYYIKIPYLYRNVKQNSHIDGLFYQVLSEMVPVICGTCQRPNGVLNSKLNMLRNGRNSLAQRNTELRAIQEIDEYTELTFPVVGTKYLDRFLNYPYIPIVEHPGVVLIAKDKSTNEVVVNMIAMVLKIWPLIFMNLLIMIIAGFIVWMLEGGLHKEADFSKKITLGLTEGFYWAYITIGTHGYGDFTPRYRSSRLFAVFFILIGLVMSSLMIGSIVTAVTTVNNASHVKLYGSQIGAISGSFEEHVGVMRNGKLNTKRKYRKIEELKEALLSGEIEGVLVDAYTAGSNKNTFKHPHLRALDMIRYPRTYGVVLSAALVHMSNEVSDYIRANQQRILEILERNTDRMEPTEKEPMKLPYEADSKIFQQTMIILSITLLVMVTLGFLYDKWREQRRLRKISSSHDKEKELMTEVDDIVQIFHKNFTKGLEKIAIQHAESLIKLNDNLRRRRRRNKICQLTESSRNNNNSNNENENNNDHEAKRKPTIVWDPVYEFSSDQQNYNQLLNTYSDCGSNEQETFEILFDTSSISDPGSTEYLK